jgi:hypothetical protein
MSDYVNNTTEMVDENLSDEEDFDFQSKLSLVVRKVQEGKTYICTSMIENDKTNDIHLVITMNTLSAGMQFFGRMQEQIGPENIIVLNSNPSTAGRCHHAKNAGDVISLLIKFPKIKVIVCCAHSIRFNDSIPQILTICSGQDIFIKTNRKMDIHIDEAHEYIPPNRNKIESFNDCHIIKRIIGYTGTPNKIWVESVKDSDKLFRKILIRDIEAELKIIRSPNYYGIERCSIELYDITLDASEISNFSNYKSDISLMSLNRAGMTVGKRKTFYDNRYPFQLGNETTLMGYLQFILPKLNINQSQFSYNFIPAYIRKVTHYEIMEMILRFYPDSNVIIMNGNGMELFRKEKSSQKSMSAMKDKQIIAKTEEERKRLLEPAYVIQKMIENYRNKPLFITGLTCVSMSVTLINQELGNFDNVVFDHSQYEISPDKLYQLCRFLFNYTNWTEDNIIKIKKTKIHCLSSIVFQLISKYEDDVEKMSTEFAGKICSLGEIFGLEESTPTEAETKKAELSSVKLTDDKMWRKFPVADGNDDDAWKQANDFYTEIKGKSIKGKSMPQKIGNFYQCSTTKHVGIQTKTDIKRLEGQSWYSTFQLKEDTLNYARVFVGYDNPDDPTEYYIYIKYAKIKNDKHNTGIIKKYGKKKKVQNEENVESSSSEKETE